MKFLDDHGEGYIGISLPVLSGSVDFQAYQLLLEKIDQILRQSGLEQELEEISIQRKLLESDGESINEDRTRRYASYAIRCTIARFLTRESYRMFSIHLADSVLLKKFCGFDSPYAPKETPSKSTLQRFEGWYDVETLRKVGDMVLTAASDHSSKLFNEKNGLLFGIDTDVWLMDSTCLKLDIHFPVDWVLLKDCVKSIIQSIIEIREHGIRHRMAEPSKFLSTINKLSMEMTNAAKRSGKKKDRKATFRKMRRLLLRVKEHGERYLKKLRIEGEAHGLTPAQVKVIEKKLTHTINMVPAVIHQAYERIIGERQVQNEDKILSIHEDHAKIYNRGKAGAQVEFGLQLLIGENADGLITHWDLIDGIPKADTDHTEEILSRVEELPENLKPTQLVGDRGFYSAGTEKKIARAGLVSKMCPKNPNELKKKLGEEAFAMFAKRRAQTEARVGIFKNNFLGGRLLSHGYENQEKHVAWGVLSHNLWVLARFPFKDLLEKRAA